MIRLTKSGEWTQTPADRMVLGCFLEAGFGRQGAKMWSEMIFNRAFREIMGTTPSAYRRGGRQEDESSRALITSRSKRMPISPAP